MFRPDAWEVLLEHAIISEKGIDTAKRGVYEELGLIFDEKEFQYLSHIIWKEEHHILQRYRYLESRK